MSGVEELEKEYERMLVVGVGSLPCLLDAVRVKMNSCDIGTPEYQFWYVKYTVLHTQCIENAYACMRM
jgi:hypothetical protein